MNEADVPNELKYDFSIYNSIKNERVRLIFGLSVSLYYNILNIWKSLFNFITVAILFITFPLWALIFRVWRDLILVHEQSKDKGQ